MFYCFQNHYDKGTCTCTYILFIYGIRLSCFHFTAGFEDLNLSDQVVSFPEETIILRKTSLKICNHTTDMTFI